MTDALKLALETVALLDNLPSNKMTDGSPLAIVCRALLAESERAERLERRLERVAGITQNLTDDVQDHSRYLSTRGKGGQQVSPCHTFASMPPSALSVVGRYARELRLATSDAEVSLAATTDTERHDG